MKKAVSILVGLSMVITSVILFMAYPLFRVNELPVQRLASWMGGKANKMALRSMNGRVIFRYSASAKQIDAGHHTSRAKRLFNFPAEMLQTIGFPLDLNDVSSLTESDFDRFVFVTAASGNHFHEDMDAIALVQRHFPNHTLYYYDLDTDLPVSTVEKLRQLCGVIYRKFDYSLYPDHVRILTTYAFKPLIIHEILQENKTVFWIDSSIRFKTSNFDVLRRQAVMESRGVLLFDFSGHSIFAATHKTMYKYLLLSKGAAINVSMMGANAIYIHCSKEVYEAVIRWWVLCALEPRCISPTRNLGCDFKGNWRSRYAKCHRFDQSALSILLANFFENDFSKYSAKDDVLAVKRGSTYNEEFRVCPADGGNIISTKSNDYFYISFFDSHIGLLCIMMMFASFLSLLAYAYGSRVITFGKTTRSRL